jgi:DNA-binding FadR family transcriptional regulator
MITAEFPSQGSEFLSYLASRPTDAGEQLPSIQEMARVLGISSGKLREQLEVARQLGLVEVRPKTGIRCLEYSFYPTIRTSLRYALARNRRTFDHIGEMRSYLEAAYWGQAVRSLTRDDHLALQDLVASAVRKLQGDPIVIPHLEHRQLHLTIYSRLENGFVFGFLEAYWDAYEAVGLNVYADYVYLRQVWEYHEQMVQAIVSGDVERGYQALVEHMGLIHRIPEMGRIRLPGAQPESAGSD